MCLPCRWVCLHVCVAGQQPGVSVQMFEAADEPDNRSCHVLVCPQCLSRHRGRPEGKSQEMEKEMCFFCLDSFVLKQSLKYTLLFKNQAASALCNFNTTMEMLIFCLISLSSPSVCIQSSQNCPNMASNCYCTLIFRNPFLLWTTAHILGMIAHYW